MATTAKRNGSDPRRVDSMWFPCGEAIRYVCRQCNSSLASLSPASAECICGNVRIDRGHVDVRDLTQFRVAIEVERSILRRPLLPAWSTTACAHDLWIDE